MPLLAGRLGNNLFMIAHAYAKGIDYNKQVVVSRPQVMYEGNDFSQNIFRKLEFVDELIPIGDVNPIVPNEDKPTFYSGYYQSEIFFDRYRENIKSLFAPPLEFIERIRRELPFIFTNSVTVINVRRGDYLHYPYYHPTVSKEFIDEAVKSVPDECYLIASDDIDWCKKNIYLPNSHYLEGYSAHEQLWILSMCHHFIISNSSFSWWAAWLSRYEHKIVIAPETWFGPEGPSNWEDMYCEGWLKMPTKFKEGLIVPS